MGLDWSDILVNANNNPPSKLYTLLKLVNNPVQVMFFFINVHKKVYMFVVCMLKINYESL